VGASKTRASCCGWALPFSLLLCAELRLGTLAILAAITRLADDCIEFPETMQASFGAFSTRDGRGVVLIESPGYRRPRNPTDPGIRCNSEGAMPSGETNEFRPTRVLQAQNPQAAAAKPVDRGAIWVAEPVPPWRSGGARSRAHSPMQGGPNPGVARPPAPCFGGPHGPRFPRIGDSCRK
jgi:hypothetical protein